MYKDEISTALDRIESMAEHDSYWLTNNDVSAISWRIQELKKFILDMYASKQKGLHYE